MKKERLFVGFILGVICVVGIGAFFSFRSPDTERIQANIIESLSQNDASLGFSRVTGIPELTFPADFGPHPEFQTEWWYYTGNLATAGGRRFGYQLTFFRRAIATDALKGTSKWRSNQIYFAHFALTDAESKAFFSFERFSRGALELAGAEAFPYRVWIEDWQVSQSGDSIKLEASQDGVAITLNIIPIKPIVLQGDRGFSPKGEDQGNASVYFSLTRILTEGIVSIREEVFQVTGFSWMDKEWSTSALEQEDVGWDWFSLQLDDNRELTLFQIRSKNGQVSRFSYGSVIGPEGDKVSLNEDDFSITSVATWQSPHSGATYPSLWKIEVPAFDLQLKIIPLIADQEHHLSFQYWEGAVKIVSEDVAGFGYVELTGYD